VISQMRRSSMPGLLSRAQRPVAATSVVADSRDLDGPRDRRGSRHGGSPGCRPVVTRLFEAASLIGALGYSQ
jgi:hypothetical protein